MLDLILALEVPASAEYIAIARLVVSSLATSRRDLAVSEACTNAIEAHRAADSDERVRIEVRENNDKFEVTIEDRGQGFDPATLPLHPPVTDPDRLNFERGLGIPLIRTLVDLVEFVPSAKGTAVRLTVYGGPAELEPPDEFFVGDPE